MQVSNVEVYYRAVSFYLEQHPDLLVDLLKVCMSGLQCQAVVQGATCSIPIPG